MANSQSQLGQIESFAPMSSGIASGLAAGASAAKPIEDAINYMTSIKMRTDAASDTLAALHSMGQIDQKTYEAVAGKSVGAQEAMIGQITAQNLANQAAARQAGLQYSGAAATGSQERQTQHQALLDQLAMYQQGLPSKISSAPLMQAQPKAQPQATTPAQPTPQPQAPSGTVYQQKLSSGQWGVFHVDANGKMVGSPTFSSTQQPNVPVFGGQQ
jgi:hypothetical protein